MLAGELEAIPYVSSATVTLAYAASSFPTHLDGFGLVIPKGEHRRVKAFTWVTSKFFGRAPADTRADAVLHQSHGWRDRRPERERHGGDGAGGAGRHPGRGGPAALVARLSLGSRHAAVRGGPSGARGAHRRPVGRAARACAWRVEPTRAQASPTRSVSAGRRPAPCSTSWPAPPRNRTKSQVDVSQPRRSPGCPRPAAPLGPAVTRYR